MVKQSNLIAGSTVLVIDDDQDSLFMLERLLSKQGCKQIIQCSNPEEALVQYMQRLPDLVLLDLHMPRISGVELMERFRRFDADDDFVPVIVITSDLDTEVKHRALSAGANDFLDKFSHEFEVVLRIENLLRTRKLHDRLANQNANLEKLISERTEDLNDSQKEVVQRLAVASEYRDDNTGRHVERVSNMAAELAQALSVSDDMVELIRMAAKLHDVGKIAIPDSILHKPAPLSPEERDVMETHTTIGSRILSRGSSELTRTAEIIARSHHEKWNGGGYPDALVGEEIPLLGRIVAVADVYDALVSKRPYKQPFSREQARQIIIEESGQHFDPSIVAALGDMPEESLYQLAGDGAGHRVWTLFDNVQAL